MHIPYFTKKQKKENLKLAVAALKSNPRKAVGQMKNDRGGRCCLCVMSEVAEDICQEPRDSMRNAHMPTFNLCDVFALPPQRSTDSKKSFKLNGFLAQEHNDGIKGQVVRKSHKTIAEMIEREYLG